MKITRVRTRQVDVPLPAPFYPAWAPGGVVTQIRLAYVRIDTDAGIYGVAGHEFFGAEEQCVRRVADYLVGEDPLRIEQHAGTLRYLWPYFGTAVWFVELALWDIVGKVAGLPVYRLLGSAHDTLPLYASTGQNRTPAQRADDARRLRDEGFRAIKLRVHNETLAEDLAQVAAVRRAVGDDMAIMVDANQTDVDDAPLPGPHWTYHRALSTARALAEHRVTWLEEPLPRHAYAELRRLHDASPIPIAGGESCNSSSSRSAVSSGSSPMAEAQERATKRACLRSCSAGQSSASSAVTMRRGSRVRRATCSADSSRSARLRLR